LWHGPPHQLLLAARAGILNLYTSATLLAELEDVLARTKFVERLSKAEVAAHDLVLGYAALARLVKPATIGLVILADPDDDAVLACAVACKAQAIVSGDSHLLGLKQYASVPIVTAAELLSRVGQAR
jgi:putative PIN family toxin of toxin-antitoxin system